MTAATEVAAAEVARLKRRLERERRSRLEAETIAERGLRELYEKQRQLQLLEAIAVAANESSSVRDALGFALAEVCRYTGWPLGHVYFRGAEDLRSLVSAPIWHGAEALRWHAFRAHTEQFELQAGHGLPGRVLDAGAAAWIADIEADADFPRASAARAAGLKAAMAFPVLVRADVAAVLEFFNDRTTPPDETLLRLMSQIGTQLGRAVERKRAEDKLVHDASHDPLTGLPNRALFLDRLQRALARGARHADYRFAVLFIDLDRFKVVNDSLGHGAGDSLIVQVGTRLLASLRREDVLARPSADGDADIDTLARLGGDEFTVLLDDIRDPSDAVRVAERIQAALGQPFVVDGHEVYASASIGIATSSTGYATPEEVLRDADLAMYRAKSLGKARSELFDQAMHVMAVKRLQLETDLRRALQQQEFVLHYQPIVSLASGLTTGFEALVRWRRAGELVYPGEFIDVAEDTGLILFLGLWVLREACATLRRWHAEFPRAAPLTMSVNVSARQFAQADFVPQVAQIVRETGVDARALRLEITESVTRGDAERTIQVLTSLREIGVRLSIDDFGTGYSSLSYLHRLPLDVLKIDRSFVAAMRPGSDGLQIVNTIMDLARNLGMDVVAEGTETAEQVAHLASLGCDFGQGYYFSRPIDEEAMRQRLREGA
jgi:diguanylate cyclase (GGDEF)-like protein